MLEFQLIECDDFEPRYNIAPQSFVPVVRQRSSGERVAHLLRWGLVPAWSKDASIAAKLTNARCETVADKPSFRAAFKARRCIIPASGFYEWQQRAAGKQPYYVYPAGGTLFGFAGLWERWTPAEGEPQDTFTVLTTAANEVMRSIHERMPVILRPADYGAWLSRDSAPESVHALLRPCEPVMLRLHTVGRAVGNSRNEGASLIDPVAV